MESVITSTNHGNITIELALLCQPYGTPREDIDHCPGFTTTSSIYGRTDHAAIQCISDFLEGAKIVKRPQDIDDQAASNILKHVILADLPSSTYQLRGIRCDHNGITFGIGKIHSDIAIRACIPHKLIAPDRCITLDLQTSTETAHLELEKFQDQASLLTVTHHTPTYENRYSLLGHDDLWFLATKIQEM